MGNNCYRKGRESGPWYELKSLRTHITMSEELGKDTTITRGLYLEWLKDREFMKADENNRRKGFYTDLVLTDGEHYPKGYTVTSKLPRQDTATPENFEVFNFETTAGPGRPRATGELSRTTAWRRRRELAAV